MSDEHYEVIKVTTLPSGEQHAEIVAQVRNPRLYDADEGGHIGEAMIQWVGEPGKYLVMKVVGVADD